MPLACAAGGMMMCSFGLAPSSLVVTPEKMVNSGTPVANIADCKPMVNILPFGMCTSLANPTVASATAAALGVLTPMPCIPVPAGTWIPTQPTTTVGKLPILTQDCKLMCAWAGVIQFTAPGQFKLKAG